MDKKKYRETQSSIFIIAAMVERLDLQGFLAAIDKAETVGPIVDPTLYIRGRRNLQTIKNFAGSLLTFQQAVAKARA